VNRGWFRLGLSIVSRHQPSPGQAPMGLEAPRARYCISPDKNTLPLTSIYLLTIHTLHGTRHGAYRTYHAKTIVKDGRPDPSYLRLFSSAGARELMFMEKRTCVRWRIPSANPRGDQDFAGIRQTKRGSTVSPECTLLSYLFLSFFGRLGFQSCSHTVM